MTLARSPSRDFKRSEDRSCMYLLHAQGHRTASRLPWVLLSSVQELIYCDMTDYRSRRQGVSLLEAHSGCTFVSLLPHFTAQEAKAEGRYPRLLSPLATA